MKPSNSTVTLPRALVSGRERFESWRQTRKRRRIPETLWREAVRLARIHGVHRTARVLRLNGQSLRERTRSSESAQDSGPAASAAFVELQPLTVSRAGYVIELEAANGARMRVEVSCGDGLDVESLTRSFLGRTP